MIALLDTSHDLKECEQEIGCPVEQLLTPGTRFNLQDPTKPFAVDNFFFTKVNTEGFLSLLEREESRRHLCRFVSVPDVVGSARRTLELFDRWYSRPELYRWPLALVAQDGQEDLPIDWDSIEAIFIGGTTDFKMSRHAVQIIKTAQALGKWTHVGRVNTPDRFLHFERLGVDSVDGSGISRYSWMREKIRRARSQADDQGSLLTEEMELVCT